MARLRVRALLWAAMIASAWARGAAAEPHDDDWYRWQVQKILDEYQPPPSPPPTAPVITNENFKWQSNNVIDDEEGPWAEPPELLFPATPYVALEPGWLAPPRSFGELVQRLPYQSNAGNPQARGGDGATRFAARGLGAQRSVVVLDGIRVSPSGLGADDAVDLDALPLAAMGHAWVDLMSPGVVGGDVWLSTQGKRELDTRAANDAVVASQVSPAGAIYDASFATSQRDAKGHVRFALAARRRTSTRDDAITGTRYSGFGDGDYQLARYATGFFQALYSHRTGIGQLASPGSAAQTVDALHLAVGLRGAHGTRNRTSWRLTYVHGNADGSELTSRPEMPYASASTGFTRSQTLRGEASFQRDIARAGTTGIWEGDLDVAYDHARGELNVAPHTAPGMAQPVTSASVTAAGTLWTRLQLRDVTLDELGITGRAIHDEAFGNAANWRAATSVRKRDFIARATYDTVWRAPSIRELAEHARLGGDRALAPETARRFALGVDYRTDLTRMPELAISYWRTTIADAIERVGNGIGNTERLATSGIDVSGSYLRGVRGGELAVRLDSQFLFNYDIALPNRTLHGAGSYDLGVRPTITGNLAAQWERDEGLAFAGALRFVGGYRACEPTLCSDGEAAHDVDAWLVLDLSVGYRLRPELTGNDRRDRRRRDTKLTLGIANVLGRDPPRIHGDTSDDVAYEGAGRMAYARIEQQF